MRAVLATALALSIALAAGVPHLHLGGHGAEECGVCLVRFGEEARCQTPELASAQAPAGEVAPAPAPSPVCGAPLGATPGQSPPCA